MSKKSQRLSRVHRKHRTRLNRDSVTTEELLAQAKKIQAYNRQLQGGIA
jgi:hypothetical protein